MQPIELYTFGPYFGLPEANPFALKALTLLKMSGLPFVERRPGALERWRGRIPYIKDAGLVVAKATPIRMHLDSVRGVDFDAGLTLAERATGWALERMLEHHTHWLEVEERWLDNANFERGPRRFFDRVPRSLRPYLIGRIRREQRRALQLQGLDRMSHVERMARAEADIDAMSNLLGVKPYLFGDRPHGTDATLFAFAATILVPTVQPKLRLAAEQRPNLRAYVDRMMGRYFPDYAKEPPR